MTSTGVKTAFSIRSCTKNRSAHDSKHLLGGQNGVVGCLPHIHRLARASQNFHNGENSFLDLFRHLNRTVRASQHYFGSLIGVERCLPPIKRLTPTLLEFYSSVNCFLGHFWYSRQACTYFIALPRRLKWRCRVFFPHKLPCTSFT